MGLYRMSNKQTKLRCKLI